MKRQLKSGTVTEFDPKLFRLEQLLKQYSDIQREIVSLTSEENQIFQTENIVGEYAEILVCERLGLTQEIASNKGYDATDTDSKRYQIKARWLGNTSKPKGKNEFGSIAESVIDDIDYVVVVLFNSDFTVKYAYKIEASVYKLIAYKKGNGLSLKPSANCLGQLNYRGYNITNKLKDTCRLRCPSCGADLSRHVAFKHADGFGFCANTYKCPECKNYVTDRYDVETKTNTVYIDTIDMYIDKLLNK